jgi:hypothetical protein
VTSDDDDSCWNRIEHTPVNVVNIVSLGPLEIGKVLCGLCSGQWTVIGSTGQAHTLLKLLTCWALCCRAAELLSC